LDKLSFERSINMKILARADSHGNVTDLRPTGERRKVLAVADARGKVFVSQAELREPRCLRCERRAARDYALSQAQGLPPEQRWMIACFGRFFP
jgi:hypothetical protein